MPVAPGCSIRLSIRLLLRRAGHLIIFLLRRTGPIDECPGYGGCSKLEGDLLIAVIGRPRQPVPGLHEIHDFRLFDLQGIIQLMDKDIPDSKIIPDTAQQQGKDAGDDVDPAISGEKFHPAKLGLVTLFPTKSGRMCKYSGVET